MSRVTLLRATRLVAVGAAAGVLASAFAAGPTAIANGKAKPKSDFVSILTRANTIVKKKYRSAQFYEADSRIKGTATKANQVNSWRFVFHLSNGTAFESYNKGKFTGPTFVAQPWLEDRPIKLPLKMNLPKAVTLMQKAGFKAPFGSITVRYPLYPGIMQPEYIFFLPSEGFYVFVGMFNGSVTTGH